MPSKTCRLRSTERRKEVDEKTRGRRGDHSKGSQGMHQQSRAARRERGKAEGRRDIFTFTFPSVERVVRMS